MRYLIWLYTSVGYLVRPYDMLTDARRWRWQARTPCRVMYEGCLCPIAHDHLTSRRLSDGQWVARATTGQVIATATSARAIVDKLNQLGPQAVGSTARFEQTEVSS